MPPSRVCEQRLQLRLWTSAMWKRWRADIFMQHAVNLRLSVCAVYIMAVQQDGRSPDPSEEVKSQAVVKPESNISAVLLQGKGQIKTLTEQGRVTRQRQGWVNFLSKRDGKDCQGLGYYRRDENAALTLILLMWRIYWAPNSIPIYIQ
jgi:hypothetical protein